MAIPYTFSNGTVADADEVNINFGSVLKGGNAMTAINSGSAENNSIFLDESGSEIKVKNNTGSVLSINNGYILLGSATLGGSSGSLEVSGLETENYREIKILASGDMSADDTMFMQINGSTGASDYAYVNFQPWTMGSVSDFTNSSIMINSLEAATGKFTVTSYIDNIQGRNKHIYGKLIQISESTDASDIFDFYGVYQKTDAIQKITIKPSSGTFTSGDTIYVWGLK